LARPKRIKLASDNAIYHVTTRTAFGTFLFKEPAIREWIYRRILRLSKCFFVELHAIAVLSNHYHLVFTLRKPPLDNREIRRRFERIQEMNKYPKTWIGDVDFWHQKLTDLSEFMKAINQSIAWEINRRHQNQGHIWGRRFYSTLIEDGPGLLACMTYVELNPVKAGLSSKPSDYRWCSMGRFHSAGKAASGVQLPRLAALSGIKSKNRMSAFRQLVDHMAAIENGESSNLPKTWADWNFQLDGHSLNELSDWCFRRTRWAFHSLLIGSASFCTKHIQLFQLPTGRNGPKAFPLFLNLCNEKVCAGDFLT